MAMSPWAKHNWNKTRSSYIKTFIYTYILQIICISFEMTDLIDGFNSIKIINLSFLDLFVFMI